MNYINIIGGGLAGCEAAHYIANQGVKVRLFEMRPVQKTPIHQSGDLAELVCSNSLKSELEDTAQGLLKKEMKMLGSLLLSCADEVRVPAGSALAVDRVLFSQLVTHRISSLENIEIIRKEVTEIPDGITIVASGPLTSDQLSASLQNMTGQENLFFFDAVAPSVTKESLDLNKVYKASRYGKGSDDYYNCPMNREEYEAFYKELIEADTVQFNNLDRSMLFEGCMPIELMAQRGKDTIRYGPLRPVGLKIPGQDLLPYAVVQLRQEDREGHILGLVGFQTRIKWKDQERVFRLIPGLEKAEFIRYGVMHRNTYINSPSLLLPTLQFKKNDKLLFAGQITGVEGYMESAATGIIAGINAVRVLRNQTTIFPSQYTMIGALLHFISSADSKRFQPMNANFGILPPPEIQIKDKKARYKYYVGRSMDEMSKFSELLLV